MECGAFDGEQASNSLHFEMSAGWTGLLIEADPRLFLSLLSHHRKAYAINACLSPSSQPMLVWPFIFYSTIYKDHHHHQHHRRRCRCRCRHHHHRRRHRCSHHRRHHRRHHHHHHHHHRCLNEDYNMKLCQWTKHIVSYYM